MILNRDHPDLSLELNRDHAEFDLSLELLATLPPWPASVPIRLLLGDLCLPGRRELNELAMTLKEKHGIETETHNGPKGERGKSERELGVVRVDWLRAQAKGEGYMNAVYGHAMSDDFNTVCGVEK